MPALVNYLKCINNSKKLIYLFIFVFEIFIDNYSDLAIEFGVVVVYTCSNSCWNDTDSYRLEHVYVQSDPDDKLFI